jgi:hypothetical protein
MKGPSRASAVTVVPAEPLRREAAAAHPWPAAISRNIGKAQGGRLRPASTRKIS